MALQSGSRLGAYEVVCSHGVGGMGEVYRARDTRLHRDVALKILPGALDDPLARRRLLSEARAAAALNHPNICTVHDVGEADGRVFEWLDRAIDERCGWIAWLAVDVCMDPLRGDARFADRLRRVGLENVAASQSSGA